MYDITATLIPTHVRDVHGCGYVINSCLNIHVQLRPYNGGKDAHTLHSCISATDEINEQDKSIVKGSFYLQTDLGTLFIKKIIMLIKSSCMHALSQYTKDANQDNKICH